MICLVIKFANIYLSSEFEYVKFKCFNRKMIYKYFMRRIVEYG